MFPAKLNSRMAAWVWAAILSFTFSHHASAAPDPFLMANGVHLRNDHGNGDIVPLRGVNLGSWLLMEGWQSPMDSSGLPDHYSVLQTLDHRFGLATEQNLTRTYQTTWIQASDLDNIKAMGMNQIRLPVWWANFQTLNGNGRADAFDRLDWVVTNAWQRGIYTIIDLHGVPGGQSTDQSTGRINQNEYWNSASDQSQTLLIWTNLASHFKNNPAVAGYDLINEPQGTPGSAALWSAYVGIYRAIRAIDPNHIIFMEGTYGSWNWSMLPDPAIYGWTNVVYEMHEYQWGSTSSASGVKAGIDNQVTDFQNHQSWNVPAYIGEFNAFGTGTDTWRYAAQQFNAHDMSWSTWAYKATHGSVPDSWGLYDPVGTWPATPDIASDSSNAIANAWSAWSTSAAFAINPMLQAALGGPLAVDDHYIICHGTTLAVDHTAGVLANDSDINLGQSGVQLAALLMNGPANGQLSFNADGSFAYTPKPFFAGTDAFRYRVSDGYASSVNLATVTIQVGPATNPPPVFCTASHGLVQLSWPPDHTGWQVQAQTNSVKAGLGTNWVTIAGSSPTNQLTFPISAANGSVFFRLIYP